MGHPDDILDTDFDSQMRGLSSQAERAIEHRATRRATCRGRRTRITAAQELEARTPEPAPKAIGLSLPQLLRPVRYQSLEAMSRIATRTTTRRCLRNWIPMLRQPTPPRPMLLPRPPRQRVNAAAASAAVTNRPGHAELPHVASELAPQIVADLRVMIESKNGLNQSMFSALHQELKGYKDGFLLESVHRPIIRDLISLYDDITGIQRQITATISDPDSQSQTPLAVRMRASACARSEMNLEHNLEFIAEVLNRLGRHAHGPTRRQTRQAHASAPSPSNLRKIPTRKEKWCAWSSAASSGSGSRVACRGSRD